MAIKNHYSIPNIIELFDQLGEAKFFLKLDLGLRYYQARIIEDDQEKIVCVTRYGSFEFLVMPFDLTNALQHSVR